MMVLRWWGSGGGRGERGQCGIDGEAERLGQRDGGLDVVGGDVEGGGEIASASCALG
jgi:hypothetical protein